jgi:hypothetical protein
MEIKLFKKIVNEVLSERQFAKRGSFYYREGEDCFCIIGIQKSNYSTGYYINVGYALKELHDDPTKLKSWEADVHDRFACRSAGEKDTEFYDLEKLTDSSESCVRESIRENVDELVEPALKPNGLKVLLSDHPELLSLTTIAAKKLLGISVD